MATQPKPLTPGLRSLLLLKALPIASLLSLQALATAPARGDLVVDARIRVNSVGFPLLSEKRATLAGEGGGFLVRRIDDGAAVLAGRSSTPQRTPKAETDELVSVLDFSALRTPGRYVIEVEGVGRSAPFNVGDDALNPAFSLVTRAFYLWRCGVAVSGEAKGQGFRHDACHLEDGWLDKLTGEHATRHATGGWHDAGDYNKYVVNAGITTGLMFKAWEQFRGRVAGVKLDLPESGNRTPDLLNELRFETDWLLTMQLEDGSVSHKVSSLNFRYWGVPERDKDPRYFAPWSTIATADFTAMLALGARHFQEFDPAYAARCLEAARRSWAFLQAHPEEHKADQSAFHTGGYDAPDATHRLWAAAEMYETTGDEAALRDFEARVQGQHFSFDGPNWGDVHDIALGTYLTSARGAPRNQKLVDSLRYSLLEQAERICAVTRTNAYGRGLGGQRPSWNWGCNGNVAAQTYLLHLADQVDPNPRYREAALETLGHILGRNYYARSYVSGLGNQPPRHMHDRRGEPAWPGYLVGGSWPDGKSWKDELASYQTNEIAINWNGALCYALAAFVESLEVSRGGLPVSDGSSDDPVPGAGHQILYTLANKGGMPLSIDRVLIEAPAGAQAPESSLKTPVLVEAGRGLDLVLELPGEAPPAPGTRVLVYYNQDTQHPLVWSLGGR